MSNQTYFGALPDSFSVDSDGGTNYCIPIELPPGTAKMIPSLSVGYNSGGGNGLLGMGWQLLGLSSITRVKATIAQDGFHGTINYDADDRFALDGVRLMLVSGSAYDSADAVYHSEIESWRKVVPQYGSSDTSNGPQSFLVYTPDGLTLEFGGGTAGSIPVSSNASVVRSWLLTKATDRNGNYMTVSYDPDAADGNNYPLQIDYTANDSAGLKAARSVSFTYQTRSDVVPQYQGGGVWQTGRLLETIQTSLDGDPVRTYTFAYSTGNATGRAQLQSVTLSDNAGNPFPATAFTWQDAAAGIFQPTSPLPPSGQFQGMYFAADLNGDGYVDLLNVYNDGGYVAFAAWFSNGTSFTLAGSPIKTAINFYQGQFLPMDVDGDGCMDLVYAYDSSGTIAATVFLSTGSGASWTMTAGTGNAVPPRTTYGTLYPMDVDGDGLTDLVCVTSAGGKLALTTLFSNGSTFAPSSADQTKPTQSYYAGAQTLSLDSTGNGLSDLLYTYVDGNETKFVLYVSQGRNGFTEQTSVLSSGTTIQPYGVLMVSDFNGDGIDDVVQAYITDGQLAIQTIVANGQLLTAPAVQTFDLGSLGTSLPVLLPMEVNGDGLPDLVCAIKNAQGVTLNVFTSTGSGYSRASGVVQPTGLPSSGGMPVMLPMDYNGDGKTDLVFVTQSGPAVAIGMMPCVAPFPDLMSSLTNGLGGSYSLTYQPLTNAAVYSESGSEAPDSLEVRGVFSTRVSGASFQVSNTDPARVASGVAYATRRVDFPKYVVSAYTKSDGRGNSYSYQQFYETALMDMTGRGWLGFASIASTDLSVGTTNLVTYSQVFPSAHNVLQTTLMKAADGVPQSLLLQTTMAYDSVEAAPNTGPGVYQVRQSSMTTDYYTYAPLTGATPDCTLLKTFSNYDDFGNAQSISQTGTALANDLYIFKQFQNDPDNWWIGFECSNKATADSPGNQVLSWQQIQYDGSMNVQHSLAWNDQAQQFLTTAYTFDACGNPLTITAPDGGVTTMTYDPAYSTFVHTKSRVGADNVTLTTTAVYYAANGEIQTFIDENGVTTSQGIDGLGQVISKSGPAPTGSTIEGLTQIWNKDNTGIFVQVTTLLDWDGATTWARQYLDGFSRSYRKVILAADGETLIYTDQEFDSRDNVVQQSLPYFENAASVYYKTQYDEYKRAVLFTQPSPVDDGSTVTTQLTYKTTNSVVAIQNFGAADTLQTTYDYGFCQGKQLLLQRSDDTGAITAYTHDALGRTTSATDPKGVTSTTSYDSMGRPIAYSSKQGSVTLWSSVITYDDLKDACTYSDAKGNGIVVQKDSLGRMLTKTVTSVDIPGTETWSFVYDATSSSMSQGRLSSVSSTSGSSYKFDYDAYGNQVNIALTVDGNSWSVQQTYKPTTELDTRTYPDGTVESHAYTPGGLLAGIGLAASSATPATQMLSFSSYTSTGKPQGATYGNGTSEAWGYGQLSQVKSLEIEDANTTPLYSALLLHDSFGALSSVTDQLSKLSQSFDYDGAKRLATASGPLSDSYQYDTAGNLTLKDGITYSGSSNQTTNGTQSGSTSFEAAFDKAGNMSSMTRGGTTNIYFYDGENQLVEAGTTTFVYDYSGRRIKKQVTDGPTVYSVSPTYQVAIFSDGSQQHSKFLCGKYGAIATVTTVDKGTPSAYNGLAAPGTFYNHVDQRGSVIRQTDVSGQLIASVVYDAYGAVNTLTGSNSIPMMFTGKEWDDSTGLYYFGARYYDPVSGRFLTADDRSGGPLASRDVMNPYAFCLNDPVNNVDPLGHNVIGDVVHDYSTATHAISKGWSKVANFTVHLVHNRAFQLAFSYTVDTFLIVEGTGCLILGFGTIGTTLLSAGTMGMIYDIEVTVKHQKFSWASWGEQLAIGAATGLIAGGAATGASMFSDYMAGGVAESVFNAGRAGSMAMNITAGALGGGAGNVVGQVISNAFTGHNLATGLGFAAVAGFVIGGAGTAIGEGLGRGLSREPTIEDADNHWNSEFLRATTERGFQRTSFTMVRIFDDPVATKYIVFLPGYIADWVGFGVSATGTFKASWIPSW